VDAQPRRSQRLPLRPLLPVAHRKTVPGGLARGLVNRAI
jgi:hypothetical protein